MKSKDIFLPDDNLTVTFHELNPSALTSLHSRPVRSAPLCASKRLYGGFVQPRTLSRTTGCVCLLIDEGLCFSHRYDDDQDDDPLGPTLLSGVLQVEEAAVRGQRPSGSGGRRQPGELPGRASQQEEPGPRGRGLELSGSR